MAHRADGLNDIFEHDVTVRENLNTKSGTVSDTPVGDIDIANKKYVDDAAINTGIDFFFYDTASSDIADYKLLDPNVSSGIKQSITKSVTGQDFYLGAWASETDGYAELINTLTTGVYSLHIHASAEIANRITFYVKLFIRNSLGVETEILESIESELIGTAEEHFDLHANLTDEIKLETGDRLVVKGYANNSSPAATNVTFYYEGDTTSRVEVRGLASPRLHNSLGNLAYADAGHTGFSPTAHTHTHASTTGRTANDHHNESHNIASHSDTTATGTELNTLTDNSIANTLHRHSELVASDGAPDPALSVDASGNVGIGTSSPSAKLEIDTGADTNLLLGQVTGATTYNVISLNGEIINADIIGIKAGATGDDAMYIDVPTGGDLRFRVNLTDKMIVASDGDVDIKNQLTITGASRMRATKSTTQSIPNVTATTILWNVEDYDNLNEYNSVNGRFTATKAGYYSINAAVMMNSATYTNGEVVVIGIHVNGNLKAWGMRNGAALTSSFKTGQVHDILYLAVDDYVEIKMYQNQGAAFGIYPNSIYNHFSVHRLS